MDGTRWANAPAYSGLSAAQFLASLAFGDVNNNKEVYCSYVIIIILFIIK